MVNLWQRRQLCRRFVQHMYSELSILHTVKVPSVYSVRLLHTIPSDLLHTHVLALQMPLFLPSISWIGTWDMTFWELGCDVSPALTLSTELNLGLELFCITGKSCRPTQLFIIFPFTYKVLQKYRQVNSNLHSDQKTIWMV